MTGYEIALAFANNTLWVFKWLFAISALGLGVALFIFAVSISPDYPDTADDKKLRKGCLHAAKWFAPVMLICGLCASFPDVDDLWKVRLGLLKLELVSPANVQKLTEAGGQHIEAIVTGLECKYLGKNCPKKEEK